MYNYYTYHHILNINKQQQSWPRQKGIHLTSAMNELDTMAKIRSVFSKAMKDDPCFDFSISHPIGGGSKSLMVPRSSVPFVWSAQEVCVQWLEGDGSILWPRMTWLRSQNCDLSDHGSLENLSNAISRVE